LISPKANNGLLQPGLQHDDDLAANSQTYANIVE